MSPPSNPRLSNGDAQLIEKFIKDLEATSDQVQRLLDTVRASELDFAAIKIELRILCENVKDISMLLRGGDGSASIVTKFALLEQKVKELERDFEKDLEKKEETKSSQQSLNDIVLADKQGVLADKQGGWQVKLALATGIIGIMSQIITTIANYIK